MCLQAKELLEDAGFAKGGTTVILGGAAIAGFFAAACSLPFDFVKTRMQRMDKLPDGTYPYRHACPPLPCCVPVGLNALHAPCQLRGLSGAPAAVTVAGPAGTWRVCRSFVAPQTLTQAVPVPGA